MLTPLLAKLPAHPAFADALNFILTGFFLVIGALLVLSGLISAIGSSFKAKDAKVARHRKMPAPAPPRPDSRLPDKNESTGGEEPVPLAAIIAAAVHVALDGQAHRVVHIEPVGVGWAREGRREIFSSHRVR